MYMGLGFRAPLPHRLRIPYCFLRKVLLSTVGSVVERDGGGARAAVEVRERRSRCE